MSASELPEDLARWPQSPFEILGVEPGVAHDALRRAYSERVRRFKPDKFPEQFQRIRAAYDLIRNRGGSDLSFFLPNPTAYDVGPRSPFPAERATEGRGTPAVDTLAEVAKRATSGDVHAAYQDLLRLRDGDPEREETYIWLFWLAVLFPHVSDDASPTSWLLTGLEKARTLAQIVPLWQLELAHAPGAALDSRYFQLIATGGRLTHNLLQWRWEAAWMLHGQETFDGLFREIIVNDVESLRSSPLHLEPRQWCQVLHLAIERLTWCTYSEGRQACNRYVEEVDDLTRIGHSLFTVDFLLSAGRDWRVIEGGRGEWARAICNTWLCPDVETEPIVRRLLDDLGRDPLDALERLDALRKRASTLLWRLDQLIEELETNGAPLQTNELEADALERFLISCGRQTYASARPRIFRFLIAEYLLPEQAATVLENGISKGEGAGGLADTIRNDVSLRCACKAARHRWRPLTCSTVVTPDSPLA